MKKQTRKSQAPRPAMSKKIHIRLTRVAKAKLRRLAKLRGVPMAEVIRSVIAKAQEKGGAL